MSIKMKGFSQLKRKLDRLTKQGAKRAMRKATRAGTTIIAKAFRSEVPVDEGNLKKATTSAVSGRGMNFRGIAGADVAKLAADERRPSNIDWLVNEGHVATDGTLIPPNRYRDRAAAKSQGPAEAAYIAKMTAEIEREAAK